MIDVPTKTKKEAAADVYATRADGIRIDYKDYREETYPKLNRGRQGRNTS